MKTNIYEKELQEIKAQLSEMRKMLEAIYQHLQPEEKLPPARVYQLKELARKKALEIKTKLDTK